MLGFRELHHREAGRWLVFEFLMTMISMWVYGIKFILRVGLVGEESGVS